MKLKTVITALLLIFVLGSVAFLVVKEIGAAPEKAASSTVNSKNSNVPNRIIAYYFHNTSRCPSCLRIETYTRDTIQNDFSQSLKNGKLEWKVINVDEPAYAHFTKDYKLYTKSVVIAEIKGGRQIRWKNLEKVWDLLYDKQAFGDYIRTELNAYLKGL